MASGYRSAVSDVQHFSVIRTLKTATLKSLGPQTKYSSVKGSNRLGDSVTEDGSTADLRIAVFLERKVKRWTNSKKEGYVNESHSIVRAHRVDFSRAVIAICA